ncbi:MAG: TRAP transporter substrate-binding protein [Chloroflexota bacterium]
MSKQRDAGRLLTRREFNKIVGAFGFTAAFGGLVSCSSGGQQSAPTAQSAPAPTKAAVEAKAAEQASKEAVKAGEFKLNFAIEGVPNRWPDGPVAKCTLWNLGSWEFKENVEKKTNGRVQVILHEGGSLGGQLELGQKTQQGVIQAGNFTTQNMAAYIPVWNVCDFPYQIGPIENAWKLLYSKEFNDVVRKASADQGAFPVATSPQLRKIAVRKGLPAEIRKPEQLSGLKIRVTGSKMEQEAFNILPANPTPIAWGEVYTAMKEGAIDGLHVGAASLADANIHEVCGQLIDTDFMYNFDSTWLNTRWFQTLPDDVKDQIMEAAYDTQVWIQKIWDDLHSKQVGSAKDAVADSIWKKSGATLVFLTDAERKEWIDFMSFEKNKAILQPLVDKFGKKEYETVNKIVVSDEKPEPKKWWK